MAVCYCGEASTHTCVQCKAGVCDDISCGMETVEGYMCGEYTQWGCARKYTTCDECCEDKAIHEEDFVTCTECCATMCDTCALGEIIECDKCSLLLCDTCMESHTCEPEDEAEAEAEAEPEEESTA